MAVKKIGTEKQTSSKKSSSEEKTTGRNSYKELSEKLKLKLQKSEEKIAELNEKYKKVVEIQKKKIEDKYKKIIENLESKKSALAKSQNNNAEINKLQKRLEKLEKSNQKLEEEKRKIELKNEELKLKAKEALKSKNEASKTDKESVKEIKALKEKLLESEQEKKELKAKLKEAVSDLKNAQKNTNKLSKEDKEQYKENLKILKQIEKESKALDKKRELLKKEEEKLKEIRGDIKTSAKDIASTMKRSYVSDDDNDDSNYDKEIQSGGSLLSDMNAKTEEGITKLAALLCAAMDDYREQKEKERQETEIESKSEIVSVLSEGEDRLNKASEGLENLVENRLEDSDSTKDENLSKRPFTIIDKIENSRVEINEGYTPPAGGQSIVSSPDSSQQIGQAAPQAQQPNITVKVEAPKESAKLAKPESQLKPASETPTMRMKLLDDIDDYEKKLVITYGFDNMPENTYYSKYKRILRNAARISLFGNLQEGLEMFKLIRDQNIPDEYKQMIDKNIQDITYYLRGLHRVRME